MVLRPTYRVAVEEHTTRQRPLEVMKTPKWGGGGGGGGGEGGRGSHHSSFRLELRVVGDDDSARDARLFCRQLRRGDAFTKRGLVA